MPRFVRSTPRLSQGFNPHLLAPPLRLDPQSYSALSDYFLTYSYSIFGHCLTSQPLSYMYVFVRYIRRFVFRERRFCAAPFYDAVF